MSIDHQEFKNALRLWASGVSIVTANSPEGELGMTATSFTSVSMDPPQILVCINDAAETGAAIIADNKFAVNILAVNQEQASNQFAGGSSMQERFANTAWKKGSLGLPLLEEALVKMECTVVQQVRAGTHWVIIGEIQSTQYQEGEPLLYFDSSYRKIAPA